MTNARVLVAYGSRYDATAEIASAIAETLGDAGLEADLLPAREVRSLEPYRAIVLGSAEHMGQWRADALRLLRRPELRERDVWLFSSGPVGDGATHPERVQHLGRAPRVEALAAQIGAHGPVVFGGRVAPDAGFIRRRIARRTAPSLRDCRDWHAISDWANRIAIEVISRV